MKSRSLFAWGPFSLMALVCGSWHGSAYAREVVCRYVNIASEPAMIDQGRIITNGALNGVETSVQINTLLLPNMLTLEAAVGGGVVTAADALERQRKMAQANPDYFGPNGKSGMFLAPTHDIAIGKMHIPDTASFVLFNLKNSSLYHVQVGGKALFSHDFELSLKEKRLKFFQPDGCRDDFLAYWSDQASVVNMKKVSSRSPRILFEVEINGQAMRATIDSMNQRSTISEEAAARVNVTMPFSPTQGGIEEGEVNTGARQHVSRMWRGEFDTFKIGEEVIAHPKITVVKTTAVEDAATLSEQNDLLTDTPDVVLAQDFLLSHHVLFAFSQDKFYFSYAGGKVFDDSIWEKIKQVITERVIVAPTNDAGATH